MTAGKKASSGSALSRLVAAAKNEYDYPNISQEHLKASFDATIAEITNIAESLHEARQSSAQDESELVELQRLIANEGGHIHRGATIPLLHRCARREDDLAVLQRRVARAQFRLKTLQSETWVLYETSIEGLKTQESKLDALLTRLEQTQKYTELQTARLQSLLTLADTIEKLAECRTQLNAGYRSLALKDLLAEAYGPTAQSASRRVALVILTRWAKAQKIEPWNGIFESHYNLLRARIADSEGKGGKPLARAKANEFFRAGGIELLLDAAAGATRDRDDFLILGNQVGRAVQVLQPDGRYRGAMQVAWLNAALALDNLEPVSFLEADKDNFDLLHCEIDAQEYVEDGPLVSVLVPAYNSQDWLPTAINSLLQQTWRNLEIVIVDDQSTDNTFEVAKEIAAKHPRVKVLQNAVNAGPYVARNLALSNSSGVFVTVHDADDWSHPRKIERQVSALLNRPDVLANTSQTVRVNPTNLQILTSAGKAMRLNYSSLMFRRAEVASALGFWDPVRFGADSEFINRIEAVFGADAIDHLDSGVLSLVRSVETSLTAGGLSDRLKGARKLYRRLFMEWHAACEANPDALRLDPRAARRFRAPHESLGLAEPTEPLPLVFVGDLSDFGNGHLLKALDARRLLQAGSGYVHMANPRFPTATESQRFTERALDEELLSVRLLHEEFGQEFKLRSDRTIITASSLFEKYNLMPPFESKVIEVLFETEGDVNLLRQISRNCLTTLGTQPTSLLAMNDGVLDALKPAQEAGWNVRLF